jgi:prepilin-type N-terminal cleavage/methylation domain-containing protein
MNTKTPSQKSKAGFTLVELLIVIAIIAIIASVAFVALDPLRRFKDTRDSRRWVDVTAILSAVKVNQVDNGGSYLSAITSLNASTTYMIGTDTSSCNSYTCNSNATSTGACVNIGALVTNGYLAQIPVSPSGANAPSTGWTSGHTGYTLSKSNTGTLTVSACEAENVNAISVAR